MANKLSKEMIAQRNELANQVSEGLLSKGEPVLS